MPVMVSLNLPMFAKRQSRSYRHSHQGFPPWPSKNQRDVGVGDTPIT